MSWNQINWQMVERDVRQMQAELVKAEHAGDERRVIVWQDRLIRSRAAKLLAVRQVTSTGGKHTAGVDGDVWNTPARKMQAVDDLELQGYQPQPARRVMIPKDDGRERPLGILTMHDRAMQALHLFALDPLAEMRADPHSYGFRKYRSTADAILACAELFAAPDGPAWVLEADIEACFDSISHDWLLRHIPLDKAVLRGWLRAGYQDKGRFHPTRQGLPQGGILSPTLANLALDGMEAMLTTYFHRTPADRARSQIAFVRYADDFIVAGAQKQMLAQEVKTLLANFLKERGMQFSARKTTLTPINAGFDFLGCHLRAQSSLLGKATLRITPSAKSVRKVLQTIAQTIQAQPEATVTALILALNPIIRGWAQHYAYLDCREVLVRLDREVLQLLLRWAKPRHPYRLKHFLLKTYCVQAKTSPPVFTDHQGATLYQAQDTPGGQHVPIAPECRAYDPRWADYLAQRSAK